MANFEQLIRSALEGKDSTSSEVRERIYRSSRKALKRMIDSNRGLTVEAAVREQNALETAIGKIEEEFSRAALKRLNESGTRDPLLELKQRFLSIFMGRLLRTMYLIELLILRSL